MLLLALALGLAGCGGNQKANQGKSNNTPAQTGGDAGDYILIGSLQDISSSTAAWGKGVVNGAQMAIDKINSEGGVLGKKLKLINYDTKNDVNEAINAYNRLVNQDKVVTVMGPPTSNIGIALAPIAEQKKVPIFGDFMDERATTKNDGTPWKYMFLGEPSCSQQAEISASYTVDKLQLKKIAILYNQANAYAVSHVIPFTRYVEEHGGQIVAKEIFQNTDKDLKAQLTKIKNANPDAIYVPNYVQENALVLNQAKQLGINIPIIGNNSYFYPLIDLIDKGITDVYFLNNVSFDDPEVKRFLEEYKSKFNEDAPLHAFFGYDNILVIAEAIKKAGKVDPEAVRDALENIKDVKGYTGNISIDPATHRPLGLSMWIMKIDKGKYVSVEKYLPPDQK